MLLISDIDQYYSDTTVYPSVTSMSHRYCPKLMNLATCYITELTEW